MIKTTEPNIEVCGLCERNEITHDDLCFTCNEYVDELNVTGKRT